MTHKHTSHSQGHTQSIYLYIYNIYIQNPRQPKDRGTTQPYLQGAIQINLVSSNRANHLKALLIFPVLDAWFQLKSFPFVNIKLSQYKQVVKKKINSCVYNLNPKSNLSRCHRWQVDPLSL